MKYPWDDPCGDPPVNVVRERAFIWLPDAVGPYSAETHILSEIFGGPSSMYEDTFARALNNSALIVGETEGGAFYWDLQRLVNQHAEPSGFLPVYDCGVQNPITVTSAFDVSDGNYPLVVGTMTVCVGCPTDPPLADEHRTRGFRHCYETGLTDTLLADVGGCDVLGAKNAYAMAVADDGLTVGKIGWVSSTQECKETTAGPDTASTWDFVGTDPFHADRLDTPAICPTGCCPQPEPHSAGGVAHDINNEGNIVGFVYHPDFADSEVPRAWFWATALSAGHELLTLGITGERMIAYAIAEPFDGGRLQVVGQSITQQTAVLWERDASGHWSALKLLDQNQPLFCNGGDHKWTNLRIATDINDHGWIVGYGTRQGINGDRAFVLVPHHCPYIECPNTCLGDINLDGVVDVSDLLALLAAWGPVGECHPADLNNDGVVDISDLLILLANWGPCPTAALGTTVPSLQETVNGAGLHMDGWDAFVHVMTDMEGDHDKENWNCWMRNYLMQCTACPACPSSDPLVRYLLD